MTTRTPSRSASSGPYPLPSRLPPALARVEAYWQGLLRGGAQMPFADDFKPTDLPDLADRLLLIDVFERPVRFRLQSVGSALTSEAVAGRFLDEVQLESPLDLLASQCSATVELAAPSFFHGQGGRPHGRLLLPLWGEGQVSLLAGAVEFE